MYRGTQNPKPSSQCSFFYLHSCFFFPLLPFSFHFFLILSNSHHMQYRKQIYLNISFLPYIFVCIVKKKKKKKSDIMFYLSDRSFIRSRLSRLAMMTKCLLMIDRVFTLPTYAIDKKIFFFDDQLSYIPAVHLPEIPLPLSIHLRRVRPVLAFMIRDQHRFYHVRR